MLKALRLMFVLLLVIAGSLTVVYAQDSIGYGDIVEGEMTEDDYEFEYTFEGSEGDVVLVVFRPVEEFGDLSSPIMMLMDASGDTVADTTDQFVFGELNLAAELPDDGEYTLLVTRADGASGESLGEFTVELLNLEVLEAGSPVEDETDSDSRPAYYAVKTEENWGLSYLKTDGTMETAIMVNTINDDNASLNEVASVDGDMLTEAAIGIFEGGETYIVSVGEPLFAFNFNTVEVEFTLELLSFE